MSDRPEARTPDAPVTSLIGAEGFIGRQIARQLSSSGASFHRFTRSMPFYREGGLDPVLLESDVILYMAGRITPAIAESDQNRVAADLTDIETLVRGLRLASRSPIVVLAGSGGTVYDPAVAPPYTEDAPTRSWSEYGSAKLQQESALLTCAGWIVPVILRLANVYGPGQKTGAGYGVIGHWLESLRENKPIRIFGDPASRRDYVHVADIAEAVLAVRRYHAALRERGEPVTVNIGSGVPTSLGELLRSLEKIVGCDLDAQWEPARTFDRRDVWLDVSRARRRLGWTPQIALADGLADTWRHRGDAAVKARERTRTGTT